jgi:hypothetical protein
MRPPTAHSLLVTWEQGRQRHPLDRGLLLYALASPEAELDTLADQPLGRRNAALLGLRRALFGDGLNACVDCPMCGEKLEFSISASQLLGHSEPSPATIEVDGVEVRLPTTRDLASVASAVDAPRAAHSLMLSLLAAGAEVDERTAVDLTAKVAAALEAADPCLDFVLNQKCPPCGHSWATSFDVVGFVWEEVEARARRLLDEVHVLAQAYGWTEREILGLTEPRRAAYLERALG